MGPKPTATSESRVVQGRDLFLWVPDKSDFRKIREHVKEREGWKNSRISGGDRVDEGLQARVVSEEVDKRENFVGGLELDPSKQ